MPGDEKMADTDEPKNRLIRFFSNPLAGGLGTAITAISVLLAIYFYLEQKEFRKLTYYVHPVKAVVVKGGQISKLTATYNDKPIKTDITVAQVAFWNEGRLSITSSNILKPIVLYTVHKTPILEATIRKVSRDVIKLQLHPQEDQNGRITISWQILEQNDGGIIQLTYAGSPDMDINVDGVIEGQKEIERIQFFGKIKSAHDYYSDIIRQQKVMGFTMLSCGLIIVLMMSVIILIDHKSSRGFLPGFPLVWLKWFALITTLGYFGIGIFYIFKSKVPGPPFGF